MAIRKPNGGAKAASTAPLTSVQDTRSRGNGNGNGERVLMSFKIPSDLKMMLQENARERGTTASRINIDNLVNKSRKDVAVTVMELSDRPSKMALNVISSIAGVIRVRVFG